MVHIQIPLEVASMIRIGEIIPNIINAASRTLADEAFTSSPCLLHDCFTFIRASVINSYIIKNIINYDNILSLIFITLITLHS